MSSAYGRLATIRDYWVPRDLNARIEVRVTDLDEVLRELVRVITLSADQNTANMKEARNAALEQPEQEPVAYLYHDAQSAHDANPMLHSTLLVMATERRSECRNETPLYTHPPRREWRSWTQREMELLDDMIEVQLHHAAQCDGIANRRMAEKQKGWDMERVALLRKIKAMAPQPSGAERA